MTDETYVSYDHRSGPKQFHVTPELALVDPLLAEHARSRLPPPHDTFARLEYLVATSRMASLVQCLPETGRRRTASGKSTRRLPSVRYRRSAVVAGGAAAGALIIALLLGVRVDLSGSPAGADTVAIEAPVIESVPDPPAERKPAVQPPAGQTPPAGRTPPASSASQRFAWAPAPRASAYHVELFRGASKIFEADTRSSSVTIPAHWKFGQRVHTLEPGKYRWYVWPLISGRRPATAIVQARLEVPAAP